MDPTIESAWIAACAAVVGVVGTATVAIVGFRISRATNQATIDAAMAATDKTIAAAHADIHNTLDTTREGQFADRYGKAIEQLGSDNLDIRVGGIYALEGIAIDSSKHHPTVMEVLAAFIRRHSSDQWPLPDATEAEITERTTRPDVQAAVTVIGRRQTRNDQQPINLIGANLTRANLTQAKLAGARLAGADLAHADLTEADLAHADLVNAQLSGANLTNADLTHADLTLARLTGANLPYAKLASAGLARANLTGARLNDADLTRASLARADVSGARLRGTDLTETNFAESNLTGAKLTGATVTRTVFYRANLTETDLTNARWSQDVPVPDGWIRDPVSDSLRRVSTEANECRN
jgi:uncharacterized protein YjbI with pentapeptide repeats